MKKKLALLLACTMAMSLTACGGGKTETPTTAAPATTAATEASKEETKEAVADTTAAEAAGGDMDALIEAAKAEGELTVYGSCEEEYLSAACKNFESLYGIKPSTRGFPPQKFTPRSLRKPANLLPMYGSAEQPIPITRR